ncbi:MAG: hypothetical protein JWQ91_2024 [Aeromicrobium sp.]|nr:hypothetical protein [Aeromicrobium sp.]MCW2825107.1 hypothetical protein [Aeromicrobium sp.]
MDQHAFSTAERDAVYRVIAERRDLRHFSSRRGGAVARPLRELLSENSWG